MKKIVLIGVMCTALLACNRDAGCNCNYDLSHHYEPHVTYRHSDATDSVHLYSVMMVLDSKTKVFHKIETDTNGILVVEYAFNDSKGWRIAKEESKYSLCEEYEVRMYEYDLPKTKSNSVPSLKAFVNGYPNFHTHEHEGYSTLSHRGVVHYPTFD